MFAVAFDMTVSEMEKRHPRSVRAAYDEIGCTLARYDFAWIQGSVYHCMNEDLANLTSAMVALKTLPWFPPSVRDIRAFRVEQWSDFTSFIKS
jgi:virulence-associated protein VapD